MLETDAIVTSPLDRAPAVESAARGDELDIRWDDRDEIAAIIRRTVGTRIVTIIPAHNEAQSIAATIASVRAQTLQPTLIIAAANNCSDGTEAVAREHGALLFYAEPNRDKKAGALNLTLDFVMPLLRDDDAILAMDADTTLSDTFIETALAKLREDVGGRGVGGVGGAFVGRPSRRAIGILQQMEFHRYRREIIRRGERALVLSGTGALLSVEALRTVKASRDGVTLPRGNGYYDTASLTEDNELTLALLTCGYQCLSPASMITTTDVMETPGALWTQRERWYLGALRNLSAYGTSLPWYLKWVYWTQQFGLLSSIMTVVAHVSLVVLLITLGQPLTLSPIWTAAAAVVILINLLTVWTLGWRARVLAVTLEPLYALYLIAIFCGAFVKWITGHKGDWVQT